MASQSAPLNEALIDRDRRDELIHSEKLSDSNRGAASESGGAEDQKYPSDRSFGERKKRREKIQREIIVKNLNQRKK